MQTQQYAQSLRKFTHFGKSVQPVSTAMWAGCSRTFKLDKPPPVAAMFACQPVVCRPVCKVRRMGVQEPQPEIARHGRPKDSEVPFRQWRQRT